MCEHLGQGDCVSGMGREAATDKANWILEVSVSVFHLALKLEPGCPSVPPMGMRDTSTSFQYPTIFLKPFGFSLCNL